MQYAIAALCAALSASAQPNAFDKTEAMVPMRDGVRLHTNIFTPKNHAGALPVIFARTPYGAIGDPAVLWSNPNIQALAGDGYIFVYQDIRGRTDSDWIVKLIDVYPEVYKPDPKMSGYELMIAGEVLRGRFHNSFERPEPLQPGKTTGFTIDLHSNNHAFLKGHRMMVQVQSTWFPLIDRNPQKFVPNIFEAKDGDFRKATQRIFRAPEAASHIELPVVAR
jgi:predicted acyl esterase